MGNCAGGSERSAWNLLSRPAQCDTQQLARWVNEPDFNFLFVHDRKSVLLLAMEKGDAASVKVIVDAAAKRGSAELARVLNQEFGQEFLSNHAGVVTRPIGCGASEECQRILFARDEVELFPEQDGKGFNVFNCVLVQNPSAGAQAMRTVLTLSEERGEALHARAVRALSQCDSRGVSPVMVAGTACRDLSAALAFLVQRGVSPRVRFTPCAEFGDLNPSRFSALALCYNNGDVYSDTVRHLESLTPLDERHSAQDPTLFMLACRDSRYLYERALEHVGNFQEFKDPFRRPLPALEPGEAAKEPELLPEQRAPPVDFFATCSLFWLPALEAHVENKWARPHHNRRFHPPALFHSKHVMHTEDQQWKAPKATRAQLTEHREWDTGFTVLHCPDPCSTTAACVALEEVRALYGPEVLRRFVRMKSTAHRWTALHMACAMGHHYLARQLLDTKTCDVNAQTDTGATALHLFLGSNCQRLSDGEGDGLDQGAMSHVLRALLQFGARDDLLTVDGDCAARLLAELLSGKDWDSKSGLLRRALEDHADGGVGDAAEAWLTEQRVLTAPLVSLVLDYSGRSQISYQRFMGARCKFVQDPKLPVLKSARLPHFGLTTNYVPGLV